MEQIRFVLERFFYGWKMNALVFDKEDQLLDFCIGTKEKVGDVWKEYCKNIFEMNMKTGVFFFEIKEKCQNVDMPIIHMEEDGIYYLAFMDSAERMFLFGPVSAEPLSFVQQISYRKRHNVSNQKYQVPNVSLADVGAMDILGNPNGEVSWAQAAWGLL